MPLALVSAARGIGDIIRVTPLVRVCRALGFEVDLLIAPDYAEAAALVATHPDIRQSFVLPGQWRSGGKTVVDGLDQIVYDVATFTNWSVPYRRLVRARRMLTFEQGPWLREGDTASVRRIASALGWIGPLPPPFASASSRVFDLPPGTVTLHPGCKPDWPWKKWHGFDALAARLPLVAVVGTEEDQQNERTYFRRRMTWPAHVRDFTGRLGLLDTAAVIRQSAAFVANDSGLMHLGVALGVTTFGIFGITSPAREAMEAPHMQVVTKGLPCEPACRRGPWGRRDCDRRLECLRTLTPDEVLARVQARCDLRANETREREEAIAWTT